MWKFDLLHATSAGNLYLPDCQIVWIQTCIQLLRFVGLAFAEPVLQCWLLLDLRPPPSSLISRFLRLSARKKCKHSVGYSGIRHNKTVILKLDYHFHRVLRNKWHLFQKEDKDHGLITWTTPVHTNIHSFINVKATKQSLKSFAYESILQYLLEDNQDRSPRWVGWLHCNLIA